MARLRKSPASGRRILVVDDHQEMRHAVRRLLELEGHEVRLAESGAEALAVTAAWQPHVILLDYYLGDRTGADLVEELRAIRPPAQIIMVTGYAADRSPRELVRSLELQGYHDKTEGTDRLLLWVDVALNQWARCERAA